MQMSSSEWEKKKKKKKHDEEQIAEIFFLALQIIWETDEFILRRRIGGKGRVPIQIVIYPVWK